MHPSDPINDMGGPVQGPANVPPPYDSHRSPAEGCLRWILIVVMLAGLAFLVFGCSGASAPAGPSTAGVGQSQGQVHLYVSWTTGESLDLDVPDSIMHDAISKIEAAAGGLLLVHRQGRGTPQIHVRIDNAATFEHGLRGGAWRTAACGGDVALEFSATADSYVLLHELGHVLGMDHSNFDDDLMFWQAGGSYRRGPRPTTFSEREAAAIRWNVAAGCPR